jgi:hypothetical protein
MSAEPHSHTEDLPGSVPGAYAALSPRARREAEHGLSMCLAWVEAPLRASLAEFDHRLFAQADRARNHLDQQTCFESRNVLQREADGFRQRFVDHLSERFEHLGRAPASEHPAHEHLPLALVDPAEQEQSDALASMAARGEARNATALFELGYRMALFAAAPPLEGEALPPGPRVLANALRAATAPLDLPKEHRLLLFQAFDTKLMSASEALYRVLNDSYRTRGILVSLRAYPQAKMTAPVATPAVERQARSEPSPASPAAADGGWRRESITVLESLRDLLAQRSLDGGTASGDHAQLATPDELQTALQALQGHLSEVADQASREIRSAQRLRDELLAQLNRNRPAGAPPAQLTPEHGDTVELTAMLFENLSRELQQSGNGRSLLGGLQFPMLRVAVADRGFFDHHDHPARQLLNTVTEVAHDWLDTADGESDRGLIEKLERLVARAGRSSTIDPEWVLEIEQHVAQLARKAQVAERRQMEAMEGRDRLEQARARASELVAQRVGPRPPRGVLRMLLERTWCDVLALNLLRGGEQGEAFVACLETTDQLLGRHPVVDPTRLRADVEDGLQQIGMLSDEAAQVARGLLEKPVADDRPTVTDVAMRLKQQPRLGESATLHEPVLPPPEQLDAPAQAIFDNLRQLRFGTWFEFTQPDGGTARRKLAWFSPSTGRCLFVNQRGVRCDDRTLTQLARLMASGDAHEMTETRLPLIDRAWQAVAGSLRRARGMSGDTMTRPV